MANDGFKMPRQPSNGLTIYLVISVILADALSMLGVWYEIFYKRDDTWQETVAAILQHMGEAVGVTLLTMATVEVIMLLSERYRERRYKEGKVAGMIESARKWKDWNDRRMSAESRGEVFSEPPPKMPNDADEKSSRMLSE